MGAAAFLNLIANLVCLRLLTSYREGDVNMSSAWECSRNDVFEGLAVLGAAAAVWMLTQAPGELRDQFEHLVKPEQFKKLLDSAK
jgi:Co/Zn/Cd efflux system component